MIKSFYSNDSLKREITFCFLDYNQCAQKAFQSLPNYGSPWYMPIGVHLDRSPAEYQDMESLLYAMLVLADVELPWNNLPFDQLLGAKQRVTGDVSRFYLLR